MPGAPERIDHHATPPLNEAQSSDLAVIATLEAYIDRVRHETPDAETLADRLHAIEGRMQAVIDLATKQGDTFSED